MRLSQIPCCFKSWLLASFVALAGTAAARAQEVVGSWIPTDWQGEAAWISTCGEVRAVVSAARARLIYFGAADGSLNLLSAPVPAVEPADRSDSPNWGGHRFWLGPQKRWVWPPLVEWEHAAAAQVAVQEKVLVVRHERMDAAYPALTREYAWEGSQLRCTVRWRDDGRPYFGMHVVAVNLPFEITARRFVWPEVPEGIVDVQMTGPVLEGMLAHPAIKVQGDQVTLRGGIKSAKVGFVPQRLEIGCAGGWRLAVSPGPHAGVALEAPDKGYLSQVWVGGPDSDLAELEQLTPYLIGGADGMCASTIFIEATAPAT